MRRLIVIILIFSIFSHGAFSEAASYDDVEFPQWAKDVRRTEIITFGSLPFVTLWTTLGYSMAVYGEFRNPLNRNTDSFTTDDQKTIMATSAGICLGLGAVDLAITLIKRAVDKKAIKKNVENSIFVTKSPLNSSDENNATDNESVEIQKSDYLIKGVVEDAVF